MKENNGLEKLIFKQFRNNNRYTQDSPVYPDVWLKFYELAKEGQSGQRIDLILTPHQKYSASDLMKALIERLPKGSDPTQWGLASSGESVAVNMNFDEMITCALPLTGWWQNYLLDKTGAPNEDLKWLKNLVGHILMAKDPNQAQHLGPEDEAATKAFDEAFSSALPQAGGSDFTPLWAVSLNRQAKICLSKSVPSTKADAGRKLFEIDGTGIYWAILDTGIDARHDAFRRLDRKTGALLDTPFGTTDSPQPNNTRILATYDFTRFRSLMASVSLVGTDAKGKPKKVKPASILGPTSGANNKPMSPVEIGEFMAELERALRLGRMLDWTIIAPLLRIPHNEDGYQSPAHPHGTHVAGIVGANLPPGPGVESLVGMCPGIELYDIRVLDQNGVGDEFNILAAIQFVRWLNNQKDQVAIHGVNFSLSMVHEVANYACGRTPVCEACERLVADGTVVVAAAGNLGQTLFQSANGQSEQGFRSVNITDPGNADAVITVGATHRNRPHTYGVSYFSSKGPTGDGRLKPDLVAPGEKIVSAVLLNATDRMDGSSMAAPHVSGAAALLLDKHRELIGQPQRVKEILCKTATDLGRERYFQGFGAVDVLRALQSV